MEFIVWDGRFKFLNPTRENLRLSLEPGEAVGVIREGSRQDLQRHVSVKLGVFGTIHSPHPAFADLGGDAVGTEGGAGFKRHLVQ